ncbi:MAG: hypothetical protein ACT4OX_09075 [Actinomycetota bacterium]
MNDSNEPLTPDVVDELLSAELDGELAAAAADLDLTVEDARRRLVSTPGVDTRRAQLGRARAVLAVEPLSDSARAEMVRRAAASGPVDELAARRGRRRPWLLSSGIAAAVMLVVGLAVLAGGGGNDDVETASDAPAGDSPDDAGASDEEAEGFVGGDAATDRDEDTESTASAARQDFGDVSDPEALRNSARATIGLDAASPSLPSESLEYSNPALPLDEACLAARTDGDPLVVRGPAQYQGQDAEVLVVDRADFYEILVVAPDCSLLASQFLRP